MFGRAFALLGLAAVTHVPALKLTSEEALRKAAAPDVRSSALVRFHTVDTDGDGVVTMEEMRRGFEHGSPNGEGEQLLGRMMALCTGDELGSVTSCTSHQLESALDAWASRRPKHSALSFLQAGSSSLSPVGLDDPTGDPCGPAAEPADPADETPDCKWDGPKCFNKGPALAWTQKLICHHSVCLCKPSTLTKRVVKLAVTGSLAVMSTRNMSDPKDHLFAPSCGGGWKTRRIAAKLSGIQKKLSQPERLVAKLALPVMIGKNKTAIETVLEQDEDITEVALFKSDQQRLVKGGPLQKVCMISWQATRDAGDWLTNVMFAPAPFRFTRKDASFQITRGLVLAYESAREEVMRAYEEECCSDDFHADRLVISGHSHGGAMAELHAVDVITNWKCRGRDLGAKDVSVVLAAPHSYNLPTSIYNNVFSCVDKANCLAGSVAVLATQGDFVGDVAGGLYMLQGGPRHPAVTAHLPCPPIPKDMRWIDNNTERSEQWWCHTLINYLPVIEDTLVDQWGWGSTCANECGDPNRQQQCFMFAQIVDKGCMYAEDLNISLPATTPCLPEHWQEEKEKCACPLSSCMEVTGVGCSV